MAQAKALVLSFDGAVCDTAEDIWMAARDAMGEAGFAAPKRSEMEGKTHLSFAALLGLYLPETTKRAEVYSRFVEVYRLFRYSNAKVAGGVYELFAACKNGDMPLAVVSSREAWHPIEMCEYFFPRWPFAYVGGGGLASALSEASAAIGIEEGAIAFCTPSEREAAAAADAGFDCILAAWGLKPKEARRAKDGGWRLAQAPKDLLASAL